MESVCHVLILEVEHEANDLPALLLPVAETPAAAPDEAAWIPGEESPSSKNQTC
jgi:hypothetical protein